MTTKNAKPCQCTHAGYHHEEGKGACQYGKTTMFGGCTCPKFTRRRRGHASTGMGAGIDLSVDRKVAEVRRSGEAAGIAMGVEPSPAARAAASALLDPPAEWMALVEQIAALGRAVSGLQAIVSGLAGVELGRAPATFPRVDAEIEREMAARVAVERPKVIADSFRAAKKAARVTPAGSALGKCERALLGSLLASWPNPLRVEALAVFSGYSLTSSSFEKGLSSLRTSGLVGGGRAALLPTAEALADYSALAGGHPVPATLADAIARASSKLGKADRYILDVIGIAAAHRFTLTREAIAERSGYSVTSSSFDKALSHLRTLALIRGNGRAGSPFALGPALEGFVQ